MLLRLFDFRGRATRNEFGLTLLWGFIAILGPELLLMGTMGTTSRELIAAGDNAALIGFALTLERWIVFVVIVAAAVRRMHDHDSPWYGVLIVLVPLVGWVLFFITMMTPSDEGPNRYGLPSGVKEQSDRLERIFD